MFQKSLRSFVGFCVVVTIFGKMSSELEALPITDLYNTGVDNNNSLVLGGLADPHWVLSSAPVGAGGPNAFVVFVPNAAWNSNTSDSQWISHNAVQGNAARPVGSYRYDLSFDLTGRDHTSAIITGDWASDNGSQILLNNVAVQTHSGGGGAFQFFDSFNLTSGFVPGVNQLSVLVFNNGSGANGTPTGVHVDKLQGTAQLIPEPSAFALSVLAIWSAVICSTRESCGPRSADSRLLLGSGIPRPIE